MQDIWKEYADDFNTMTDEEIESESQSAQNPIDENESWTEAVASWKAAGKPRTLLPPQATNRWLRLSKKQLSKGRLDE
tara:strand:- start:347 stop:580 length:234 start_codon:yes stop_codon:yes gene_type:complete